MAQDRYWLFDGKDATGPFYSDELKRQPLFGPESLICPDGSDDANAWRPAKLYLVKGPGISPDPPRPVAVMENEPEINAFPSMAPDARPAPAALPIPPKVAAIAAAVLLTAAAAAYLAWSKHKKPSAMPSTAVAPAVPQAPPPAEAPVNQEAVDFVLKFPAISDGAPLPAAADDVFTAARWRAPESVGEALDMKSFYTLGQAASAMLQKQGRGPQSGEAQIKHNRDLWDAYSQRFIKANYRTAWTTELSASGTSRWHVIAEVRYHREGPREIHDFEADVDRRTLKPLNLEAWYDLDPVGCANWADKNVSLGEPVDEVKLAAASPAYTFPLPQHGLRKKKPSLSSLAASQPSPKKKAKRTPKPVVVPPVEEADYPDAGAPADDNPLVQATQEPAAKRAAKSAPKKPAAANDADSAQLLQLLGDSPKPAAAPARPAPAAAKPPQGDQIGKPKDAEDMSVDELEKYLSRGSGN